MARSIDYTGRRIGELTVKTKLGKDPMRPAAGIIWLCECDCGKEQLRSSKQLGQSIQLRQCPACPRCLGEVRRGRSLVRRSISRQRYVEYFQEYGSLYNNQQFERELRELRQESGLPEVGLYDGIFDDPEPSTYDTNVDWEIDRHSDRIEPGLDLTPYGESLAMDCAPQKLAEVGKMLGVSIERVRQIELKALRKLKVNPDIIEITIGKDELLRKRQEDLEKAHLEAEKQQEQLRQERLARERYEEARPREPWKPPPMTQQSLRNRYDELRDRHIGNNDIIVFPDGTRVRWGDLLEIPIP